MRDLTRVPPPIRALYCPYCHATARVVSTRDLRSSLPAYEVQEHRKPGCPGIGMIIDSQGRPRALASELEQRRQ